MLKRLAILGLLLAAMPPMPGQAAKAAAQGGDKVQTQGQGDKTSPAPAPSLVKKPIEPGAADPHGGPVAGEDKEHSIKLISLPPVTLTEKHKTFWDNVFDWGPWVFNGLLVVVGFLQVWLLRRTWKVMGEQAKLMKQMNTMAASRDRARLRLRISHQAFRNAAATESSGSSLGTVQFEVFNYGPTAATEVRLLASCFISEISDPALPNDLHKVKIVRTIRPDKRVHAEMDPKLHRSTGKFLHLMGELIYDDVFQKEPWSYPFHYAWKGDKWIRKSRQREFTEADTVD